MEEKTKNLILGTTYSTLLLIIFASYINRIIMYLLELLYPKTNNPGPGVNIMPIPVTPIFAGAIIAIMISLVLTYAIIRLVRIERINEFLIPNGYKISMTVILLAIIIVIGFIIGMYYAAGNPNSLLMNMLISILTLGSNYLNKFMMWLYPIIIYYVIVCLMYKRYVEDKELPKVHNR